MSRTFAFSLFAICTFGLFTGSLTASAQTTKSAIPRVIYGEDNRLDYFQVQNEDQRLRAQSTVALIHTSSLTPAGEMTSIATVPYGAGRGLCTTEPFYEQETAAFCSGFLIAPDLVVTAGHCVRDQSTCLQTNFVFGFRLEHADALPRQVATKDIYSCHELIHSVSLAAGEDFALIRLDRAVMSVPPLAYRTESAPSIGDQMEVMGHPSGLPLKIAGGAEVRQVTDQFFVTNLDTYGGNSGSAVFNSNTGLVEGVLVRGNRDFEMKNGCYVSVQCPSEGCRGEDVTLIKQVLPYLSSVH